MNFSEYQKKSRKTAIYPEKDKNFLYPAFGLAGEVGEVIEKLKHVWRDKNKVIDNKMKKLIMKELGDVLWYLAQLATELGFSLEKIAILNLKKLSSRQRRGKIFGNGDNR